MTRVLWLLLAGVGVLCCARLGEAGPVAGNWEIRPKIGERSSFTLDKDTVLEEGKVGDRVKFKGGRRACVIVEGDHNPVVPVILEVHDEKGKLVGVDNPRQHAASDNAPGNDVCAVIWYPPRDGYYKITIKNLGTQWNQCWIAIK
jgi:hypothetical protein